jgi:hypothetical protein
MINNAIDFDEFKEFYETVGETITQADFNSTVIAKYISTDKGLTLKGFKDFWKDSLKANGVSKIWDWLNKLGYDKELYSSFSRSFIFTIHSDQPIVL